VCHDHSERGSALIAQQRGDGSQLGWLRLVSLERVVGDRVFPSRRLRNEIDRDVDSVRAPLEVSWRSDEVYQGPVVA
jgi:hypothetical protein